MVTEYTYSVTDEKGNTVDSGSFKLDAGQSTTVTVKGTYGLLTLSITDDQNVTTKAATATCVKKVEVNLSATGACIENTAQAKFIITNNGPDAMDSEYTYQVQDANGNVVDTNSFKLAAGQSATINVNGAYGTLKLIVIDDKNVSSELATTTCTETSGPKLSASGVCIEDTAEIAFTIINNGTDMTSDYTYEVKDANGKVVDTGTFKLTAGQSTKITVSGGPGVLTLFVTDDKQVTKQVSSTSCKEPKVPELSPAKSEPCIQCLIFHTFRDNNLEIYRLDGIEGQPGYKLYNLSQGDAVDSRPSRAPNDSRVVFQSNRDGNVELYTTDMLGSSAPVRLTRTNSNNTNPMYGPDARTIVYQSDRNGNFDIFTIDDVTGVERQVTSDQADDSNPFYSPDLRWIVFQSNRNNNWDLYVLDLETGNEIQLTNTAANETFPAWSPNGKQISFLSDVNGGTDLYIIDANGENLQRITTDGKTNNIAWSPEGYRLAYQSERNGNLDVYSYDLKAAKEYHVTDYIGPDSGPTWDCGGTNLAFTSIRDGDPNVFQVFWQGGPAGNMTIDPATDKWSQWRPSNDVSSVGY
jgi:Tol biopolymer transport system component